MVASAQIWTIKAALDWTEAYLGRKGDENPRLSAQLLLSDACGMSRIELYANFDRPLSLGERDKLREFVARRGNGEPIQYITGETGFRFITVKVRPGVLIPRPETEVLVSEALSLLPPAARPRSMESVLSDQALRDFVSAANAKVGDSVSSAGDADDHDTEEADLRQVSDASLSGDERRLLIADICTGSGCIACSVASEHSDACVIATDIAPCAVSLARENARTLGLEDRVRILQGDLGTCIPDRYIGRFDLVVSNPPYVPTQVCDQLPLEVADYEPRLALDGGADGLDLFRRLAQWTYGALKPGGGFAVELHETCLDEASRFAQGLGFCDVRIVEDLAGRPRVLTARKH